MFDFNPLSVLFLFLILLGVIPNLFYMSGYLSHIKRKIHFLINYFAFIFAMIGVVLSNEVLPFLFFWELMSITSWQLILTERNEKNLQVGRFYFFMTHFGYIFILMFFLLLSPNDLFASFDVLKENALNFKYPTLLFFLITIGFLSKAGVVPLHVWLPYAHPEAPSPVSALPPTNGFLSEWMVFQSMLSSDVINNIALKISFPFAIFALALTGGLAIACFVKAFGITFLGLHRSTNSKHAKEVNSLMKIGQILMAIVVISLMLFFPFIIKEIDLALPLPNIYSKLFPNLWSMHSLNNGGVVSPLLLLAGLLVIVGLIYLFIKQLNLKTRIFHTWACGYNVKPKYQYSATGFAGPIRRFFAWLYKPEVHIHEETIAGHKTKFVDKFYDVHVKPLFEKSLYDGTKKIVNLISYYLYRESHFEKSKYSSFVFLLVITALFSFRIFYHEVNWGSILLEISVVAIISAILLKAKK